MWKERRVWRRASWLTRIKPLPSPAWSLNFLHACGEIYTNQYGFNFPLALINDRTGWRL